ncbi:hypothetical protein BDZ89DRAFT_1170218 [Hymenopellis radicata]|nr:hypothetical protein BDZ89DRAFT_1170218 [Hymenopellis radicata]
MDPASSHPLPLTKSTQPLTFIPHFPPTATLSPPPAQCYSHQHHHLHSAFNVQHAPCHCPDVLPASRCPSQYRRQCRLPRTRVASSPAFDVDAQKRYSVFAEGSLPLTITTCVILYIKLQTPLWRVCSTDDFNAGYTGFRLDLPEDDAAPARRPRRLPLSRPVSAALLLFTACLYMPAPADQEMNTLLEYQLKGFFLLVEHYLIRLFTVDARRRGDPRDVEIAMPISSSAFHQGRGSPFRSVLHLPFESLTPVARPVRLAVATSNVTKSSPTAGPTLNIRRLTALEQGTRFKGIAGGVDALRDSKFLENFAWATLTALIHAGSV